MKIIVDAFGGDNSPEEILKGCADAAKEMNVEILLSGNRDKILKAAAAEGLTDIIKSMEILHCEDALGMEDEPGSILKRPESSMAVGLKALADGRGDAFASAGNSGALVVGSTMLVKRIKGVRRVTFAPVLPKKSGFFMLADGGANVDCRPGMLMQFGLMGSIYMKHVMGVETPRVALVNVGSEPGKGDELRIEAYKLLQEQTAINFTGNVEAREIPYDGADVVVTDGFNGNVLLKLYEGLAGALMDMIKDVFNKSAKNKLAAALVLKDMKQMKKALDYNEYGGAPIMGVSKPVFKIHGSARASTVKSGIRLTRDYVDSGITGIIAEALGKGQV